MRIKSCVPAEARNFRKDPLTDHKVVKCLKSDVFFGQVFQQCPAKDKTRNDPVLTPRFSQIREAYEILGDKGQRAIYDSAGLQLLGG